MKATAIRRAARSRMRLPPRRAPSQQRSRERVERMLAAASALIAERAATPCA